VSGETTSLGSVGSRRHSVQTTGDVRVQCWRLVIGRGKFKPSGETCSCAISQPHIPHLQVLNPGLIGVTPEVRHLSRISCGKNLSVWLSRTSNLYYGGTCFNPHRGIGFPDIGICGFPPSLNANSAPGPQIRTCLLPPTFFPVHYFPLSALYVNNK
jgi:hypothetical protein